MLKTTQNQLKKKYQTEIAELKQAIHLRCSDCMGYFSDGYFSCDSKCCPLHKFYPTKGKVFSQSFKKELLKLAKDYHNDEKILQLIQSSATSKGVAAV